MFTLAMVWCLYATGECEAIISDDKKVFETLADCEQREQQVLAIGQDNAEVGVILTDCIN